MPAFPADGGDKPLAVSMGDPAGIGPDIALLSWARRNELSCPLFFVAGDAAALLDRAKLLPASTRLEVQIIQEPEEAGEVFANALPVLPLTSSCAAVSAGKPDSANAGVIIELIEKAVALTISGRSSAVVTSPIAKFVLLQKGFAHAGHTEFLAELACRHNYSGVFPVMLMASKALMAVPVTVHIPFREVPAKLTKARLTRTARITNEGLRRYFGVERPRLAVCGLNPHAGENGELGREEIEIISPAVEELRSEGIAANGPFPGDTLFHKEARDHYDAVLAMYHDQALIPFKTLSFEDGVNVTLGLPFIRTSPDHGTAFPLAGTGRANPASFLAALNLASGMGKTASRALSRD